MKKNSSMPVPVEVSVNAPNAKKVFLTGSFNEWNAESNPMQRRADGSWGTKLDLAPGRYEYKFVIDGTWCCEPGCDDSRTDSPNCVPNPFGTMNCVLVVEGPDQAGSRDQTTSSTSARQGGAVPP